jgi:hypothetical protein
LVKDDVEIRRLKRELEDFKERSEVEIKELAD